VTGLAYMMSGLFCNVLLSNADSVGGGVFVVQRWKVRTHERHTRLTNGTLDA